MRWTIQNLLKNGGWNLRRKALLREEILA